MKYEALNLILKLHNDPENIDNDFSLYKSVTSYMLLLLSLSPPSPRIGKFSGGLYSVLTMNRKS